MKSEVAVKWIAALKSGEYQQGTECLASASQWNTSSPVRRHCCLDVLCELAAQEGVIPSLEPAPSQYEYTFLRAAGEQHYLPTAVQEWAGLKTPTGKFDWKTWAPHPCSLAHLNDSGESFAVIASVIEEEWEAL